MAGPANSRDAFRLVFVVKHLSPKETQEPSGRTLTRVTLTEAIYSACRSLTRAQAASLLDEVLEEIAQAVERGEEVALRSFGKFKVRAKRERIGRNPSTGVEAIITARRVLTFKASAQLIAEINAAMTATAFVAD